MLENLKELSSLFNKIQENRKIYHLSENISLDELKKICDESTQFTSVVEFFKYSISIVYNNKNAVDFLNMSQKESLKLGFNFFLKVIHPENIGTIYSLIKFFNNPDNVNKIYSNTFYVKSVNGWEWVYNSMKPVTFNKDGTIKYMLSASCSITESLKSKKQFRNLKNNLSFYEENLEKYLSMTNQEKEILVLLADESTVAEIAELLSVPAVSVEKTVSNLTKKFNVKSPDGLIKYAMLFHMV